MKLSIQQESLKRGLAIVSRAVASRSSVTPILANVLLSAENDKLKLSATNLEMAIVCWAGARVDQTGAITLPAKTLIDLVNTFPSGVIEMKLNERTQTMCLICGDSKVNIKGLDAQDFPQLSTELGEETVAIESSLLKKAIEQTAFAASVDQSRLVLTGVVVELDDDLLTLSSADSFRVSVSSAELETPTAKLTQAIVPATALSELARIVSDQDEIEISFSDNRVLFCLDGIDMIVQLINLPFPDFKQIMSGQRDVQVKTSTDDLLKAVKAASIFARDSSSLLKFQIQDDSLTIIARSDETGDSASTIAADIQGGGLTIGFNARFVLDWLKSVKTDQVVIRLKDSNHPGLFLSVGDDDYQHVIMPMQTGR